MSDKKYLVLTCDGGGIRGFMTSLLLADLEQSAVSNVDFYAGSSTGATIAIGLASGMHPAKIASNYECYCSEIFTPFFPRDPSDEATVSAIKGALASASADLEKEGHAARVLQTLEDLVEILLFPTFTLEGAVSALGKGFPDPDLTLGEIWPRYGKRVLTTTVLLDEPVESGGEQWQASLAHNLPGFPSAVGPDATILDAAMCSCTYPPSYPMFPYDSVAHGDGGLFASNPSSIALAAVVRSGLLEKQGLGLENVYLLSLGTGFSQACYPPDATLPQAFPGGFLAWMWPAATSTTPAFPLLAVQTDAVTQIDDFTTSSMLGQENYRRGNVNISGLGISSSSCDQFDVMTKATNSYIASDEWQEIKQWVHCNFMP